MRQDSGILGSYEAATDQKLNWEKTSVFFSRNTKEDTHTLILNAVGVNSTQQYEKYLKLPALVGCSRITTFNVIKGRI
jgi:hypothetical protein